MSCLGNSFTSVFSSRRHGGHGDKTLSSRRKPEPMVQRLVPPISGPRLSLGRQFRFSLRILRASVVTLLLLAQLAAHDLAGRGERQFVDKADLARRLVPRQTLADKGADLVGEGMAWRRSGLRPDERPDKRDT